MKDSIKYIRDNITEVLSKVHYFSDRCPGQYKNCKNFLNFYLHNSDFGVKLNGTFLPPVMGSHHVMVLGEQ